MWAKNNYKLWALFFVFISSFYRCYTYQGFSYKRWSLFRIETVGSKDFPLKRMLDAFGNKQMRIIDMRKGQMDIAVSPSVSSKWLEALLNKFQVQHKVLHSDVGSLIKPKIRKKKRSAGGDDVFDRYLNPDQMESYFTTLEKLYPARIRKEVIGKSFEGRKIYLFTVSDFKSEVDCGATSNQVGEVVLLDRLEHLRTFHPVLSPLGPFWLDRGGKIRRRTHRSRRGRSRNNEKEIPRYILRRIKPVKNETHNYLYFNLDFLRKNVSKKVLTNSAQFKKLKKVHKSLIFLDAGTHSREWVTPAAAIYLIKYLAENPHMTERLDWKIVPMANPDGYAYSWYYDRFWRKTRSNTSIESCQGVDINRNFGHHWREVDTSNFACFEHYGGPYEFSEAETVALRNALLKERNRIKAYISIHNWGQDVVYPYSFSAEKTPPTHQELKLVSDGIVEAISKERKTKYESGPAATLIYPASGTAIDWVYDNLDAPLSFLFELRDSNGIMGFVLPERFIKPTSEDLVSAVKYLSTVVANDTTSLCS